MKTYLLSVIALIAILLASCNKEAALETAEQTFGNDLATLSLPSSDYTSNVVVPLEKSSRGDHYVKGKIDYIQNGEVIASIDYGNGKEDNVAKKTIDGKTVKFFLKKGKGKSEKGKKKGKDDKDRKDEKDGKGKCDDGDDDDDDYEDEEDEDEDEDDYEGDDCCCCCGDWEEDEEDDWDWDEDEDEWEGDCGDDEDEDDKDEEDYYTLTKVIVTPLVTTADCTYIVEGIIKYFDEDGKWLATIDYGDGTCDNIATKETYEGVETFNLDDYMMDH
ncbi:MAG: hypothetical protein MK212_13655 [Saprospiraceae bacterium]|nr:hypothetical protein [Saprospiraceae bacterium]